MEGGEWGVCKGEDVKGRREEVEKFMHQQKEVTIQFKKKGRIGCIKE